jgi:hypothetical protein
VLLASGKTAAISSLKPGEKVTAADPKTGKPQAKAVAAVLVHYDTDLYDLAVEAGGHTEVIHTTSSHLFWDPATRTWVKAHALKKGEHLRTAGGQEAIADGGHVPAQHDGWMWDLTVQGDHDFYVTSASLGTAVGDGATSASPGPDAVLVHNCPSGADEGATAGGQDSGKLSDIADKVQAALGEDERADAGRTVAIMRTSDGRLVAANAGHAFTGAQVRILARMGIGRLPFRQGMEAEVHLMFYAARSGDEALGGGGSALFGGEPFTPAAIGASRPICAAICRVAIENSDFPGLTGRILGDGKNAVWEP